MFMLFLGFVAGWWACSWYIQNDRSFERAFMAPARGALESATDEATSNGRGRARATASRRARRV
jgi:hypothetical protein